MGIRRNEDAKYTKSGGDDHLTECWHHIIMEMSSSQEWMGKKWDPVNNKHRCKSKIDTDLDIDPIGDNRIVSKNEFYVTIDPGSPPWEEKPPPWRRFKNTVQKDAKLEYGLE